MSPDQRPRIPFDGSVSRRTILKFPPLVAAVTLVGCDLLQKDEPKRTTPFSEIKVDREALMALNAPILFSVPANRVRHSHIGKVERVLPDGGREPVGKQEIVDFNDVRHDIVKIEAGSTKQELISEKGATTLPKIQWSPNGDHFVAFENLSRSDEDNTENYLDNFRLVLYSADGKTMDTLGVRGPIDLIAKTIAYGSLGQMTWAPDGKSFLVYDKHGVYEYDLATRKKRDLVSYDKDLGDWFAKREVNGRSRNVTHAAISPDRSKFAFYWGDELAICDYGVGKSYTKDLGSEQIIPKEGMVVKKIGFSKVSPGQDMYFTQDNHLILNDTSSIYDSSLNTIHKLNRGVVAMNRTGDTLAMLDYDQKKYLILLANNKGEIKSNRIVLDLPDERPDWASGPNAYLQEGIRNVRFTENGLLVFQNNDSLYSVQSDGTNLRKVLDVKSTGSWLVGPEIIVAG